MILHKQMSYDLPARPECFCVAKMYRRVRVFIFAIVLITSSFTHPLSYDSAIYKAQKGNWQDAHVTLSSMITHNPDSADVMYDAGVAAYNLGNRCQAATCFARAAEHSKDKNIAFRAHFNAGNTYVDEKDLQSALAEYDKALAIEPDNEYARHNRDRVAHMLQEKQSQQNKDNEQNQEDKQNQDKQENKDQCECDKQNQDKQDQKNQDGQNQDQQQQNGNDSSSAKASADRQKDGRQNQNGNDKQKNDSLQDDQSTQQSQGNGEQKDTAKGSNDAQRKKHGDKKDQHKNSANNEKRNGKDELDKESQSAQKESNKQQGDKHGTTPENQHEGDDKSNVSPEDGQEQAITDPWLLSVLNNQEKHDKAINKQLMEAKIRQHGGKHGQNCW